MQTDEIEQYLTELNDGLREIDVKGEVCLYGGAVMCLAYKARPSTKDVDAIFEPMKQIRKIAGRIAEIHNLPKDWLNYGVKMFLVEHKKQVLFDMSHLKVYIPTPDYLLAMKALAARVDTSDKNDVRFLIKLLKLNKAEQVFDIIKDYYPHKQISPTTQFFIEELFEA